MGFVIVTTAEDGTPAVWGTPAGHPYGSHARAEQVADLMRNPHSSMWIDATMVMVLPVSAVEF
jgi:hypothetical protein